MSVRDVEAGDGGLCPRSGASPSLDSLPAGRRRSLAPHLGGGEAEAVIGGLPARWEPEGLSPSDAYPRSVTPGIETHDGKEIPPDPGVYARLDWLRVTGPDSKLDALRDYCIARFGPITRATHGAKYFKSGWDWDPGVQLSHGHRSEVCMLDVRGERLRRLPGEDAVAILQELLDLGFKPTRIDGAIDWIGQDVKLYENAVGSCEAGELCRLRTYSPRPERRANGLPIGLHLALGKRQSAICARIYDKGLEQRLPVAGYWERLEVEFKDDRAVQFGRLLAESGERWMCALTDCIVGAVDFRKVGERSEVERRRRVEWWAILVKGLAPRSITPEKSFKGFDSWLSAFRASYGKRLLQLAAVVGRPVTDVVTEFLNDLAPSREKTAVVQEFKAMCLTRNGRRENR